MRENRDPLFPILATAVSLVVLGALVLVFVPSLHRWFGASRLESVHRPPPPTESVLVWACRTVDGAALLLKPYTGSSENLAPYLDSGPETLLVLSVFNFSGPDPFELEVGPKGLVSPEGGAPALAAARLLKADVPASLRPLFDALGATTALRVPRGHSGQLLLAVAADPGDRTAFMSGDLKFERVSISRLKLASWLDQPDWKGFLEF